MASNGLFPAFVKIFYTSPYATHSHTIPMRAIVSSGLGDAGNVTAWNAASVQVDGMVEDLIDILQAFVSSTTTYNRYVVYRVPTVGAAPQPIFEKAYGGAGSGTGITGQAKAVQMTGSFRTANFGLLKIVHLDRATGSVFDNSTNPSDYSTGIIAEITNPAKAWSGRDDSQPLQFTNMSRSLNKRLRRKYGMI